MGRRAAAVAALAGLLACAAGSRIQAAAPRKPVVHTVTIDGARFSPSDLDVHVGDQVLWVNKDILAHTATSKSPGFDSKVIQPGQSWRFIARKKGEFPYTCSFHPMNGMLKVS